MFLEAKIRIAQAFSKFILIIKNERGEIKI